MLDESKRVVFFGGAGVSTESGIPDFRSADGLYNQEYAFPPEEIISRSFFNANTSEFYRFYRNKMLFLEVKPNSAHIVLAELEIPVITQNIDGLHQAAGSSQVHELHGSVHKNYCMRCNVFADLETMVHLIDASDDYIPKCPVANCGGVMKPAVVLYEEPLDQTVWSAAQELVEHADTLVVGGTSFVVYPAASMIQYFSGRNLVFINKQMLDFKQYSNFNVLQINDAIGQVFQNLQ
ncbi:MAG: NAD-dependent protein deacylase [Candidatus Ancillula trichonymphae]|jgi:NAD-dependent deacetylase|nr:NAD-dependent protein deacylase [Candidatus Ancillula trichonymphae]